MDGKDLVLLGVVVGAAMLIASRVMGAKAAPAQQTKGNVYVNEITTQGNKNGWRYYDDGTAVAPNGDYYFQGNLVYKA